MMVFPMAGGYAPSRLTWSPAALWRQNSASGSDAKGRDAIGDARPHLSALRRATIFVSDIDRAIAFYGAAFGLTPWFERPPGALPEGFPVGEPGRGGGMRFVILRGHDPQIGMLGVIEITDPPLARRQDHRLRQGSAALIFETSDIERTREAILSHGGALLRDLREGSNFGSLKAERIAARTLLAADPDEQYLEVFERTG